MYSELFESLSPIFAARAGKSSSIFPALTSACAMQLRRFFRQRQWRRPLGFAVFSGPEDVDSLAPGARSVCGWFFHFNPVLLGALAGASIYLSVCALGTGTATTISPHWRGGFPWVNFADVFGND